jgi:hypothetical protein
VAVVAEYLPLTGAKEIEDGRKPLACEPRHAKGRRSAPTKMLTLSALRRKCRKMTA